MSKSGDKYSQQEDTQDSLGDDSFSADKSNFVIGAKLEATDASGVWYAARVENVNWEEREVLVHFERWSCKFDEWIPMCSNRLRSIQKPLPPKPPPRFERGQQVIAVWSAYNRCPATVQRALPDGKYEVLFEDGFVKRLLPSKMWHLDDVVSSPRSPAEASIGSKQDRRDRKRKLVVSELFRSNKKVKTDPNDKKTVAVASTSSAVDVTHMEAPAPPPGRKSLPPIAHAPPKPIEVRHLDGRKETWLKMLTRRSEGKTAGKLEIVICSASGRKFRSRADIIRYCEENKILYEPTLFDFSAKGRSKAKSIVQGSNEVADEEVVAPVAPPVAPDPPVIPMTAPLTTPEPVEEERRFIGDLEVIVQDGQFICPVTDCRKHFRRENLLHMHMKHYHPELSKYLDYTPSVTDLAYARTVSLEQQEGSPTVRPSLRSDIRCPDVKRSPVRIRDCRVEMNKVTLSTAVDATPPATIPEPAEDATTTDPEPIQPIQPPSLAEVGASVAPHEAVTESERDGVGGTEGDLEAVIPASVLQRPKIHWKRRPYHRHQLPLTDWYGRMGKQAAAGGAASEASGKQKDEESGDLVQRNPILNTLLSSRPLAPTLGWRPGWRRRRRGGWNKRRPPRTLPPALDQGPTPLAELTDGLEDSKPSPGADGSDLSKSPGPADGEKYEKLRGNEIINCTCQMKEEDGLMIQCDVCQCWQHGHCLGIAPQGEVPESYVCSVCKDPPKGRSSRKYYNHQDWLKQGVLPTLPFKPKSPSTQRQNLLKRAFEMSGQLSLLSRLLHSLRVKLNVAGNKDHPKLWLWARRWQEAHKPSHPLPTVKEEEPSMPKAPEPEKPIDPVECKMNLLEHIQQYHDLVQERLNTLEAQVTDLENMQDDAGQDETPDSCPRTSATIKMLLRDLDTVKRVATLP